MKFGSVPIITIISTKYIRSSPEDGARVTKGWFKAMSSKDTAL